jgi:hypothetical protein
MAHFAELDDNNIVLRVIVVSDDDCDRKPFPESCLIGSALLNKFFGGKWKQTSYNNNFRKSFAGIGMEYDESNDVFIHIKPYPSWSLNENFDWQAPVPCPSGDKLYYWSEETQTWVE